MVDTRDDRRIRAARTQRVRTGSERLDETIQGTLVMSQALNILAAVLAD